MQDVLELAGAIAARLGAIRGIAAVALIGSWARGEAPLDADIELGLFYHDEQRPGVEDLRALALELNSFLSADVVTEVWAQGPLVNGGASLWVEGRRIDWHYRDLSQIGRSIEQCRAGVISCYYQPGYPHGYFSHYPMGEIHHCRPLHDPAGVLARLKRQTETYPERLKRALVDAFSREADLTLFAAQKAASQEDLFYAAGCIYRCIACLVQVLFAVNEHYFTSERNALDAIAHFEECPPGFIETISGVLAHAGGSAAALQDSIDQLRALVGEVQLEYVKPLGSM